MATRTLATLAMASGARFGLPLAALLVVAGCAGVRQQPPLEAAAGVPADFRVQGRIAVRGKADAFSASFDWRQAGDSYRIEFWGPLGQGRMLLHGDGDTATVTDARGRSIRDIRPDALLEQELGWSAPLDALRYWVLGRGDPSAAVHAERRDAAGRPAGFEQHGWTVELSRWRADAAGETQMPAKIVATRGDNRVAIVCKEWWIDG